MPSSDDRRSGRVRDLDEAAGVGADLVVVDLVDDEAARRRRRGRGRRRPAVALELDHVAGSRGDRDRARGSVLALAGRAHECAQRGERRALRSHRSRRSRGPAGPAGPTGPAGPADPRGPAGPAGPLTPASPCWPGWACGTSRACRSWCPVLVPCHHALAGPTLRRITDDPQERLLACRDRRRPGRGRRARGKCSASAEHDRRRAPRLRSCVYARILPSWLSQPVVLSRLAWHQMSKPDRCAQRRMALRRCGAFDTDS